MKSIIIKDIHSGKTKKVTQLLGVCDVNEYINSEKESLVIDDDLKGIIRDRNVNHKFKEDRIDKLMNLYKYINQECNLLTENSLMGREDILEVQRENMIDCIKRYGEVWLNPNGTYCTPIKGYKIIEV